MSTIYGASPEQVRTYMDVTSDFISLLTREYGTRYPELAGHLIRLRLEAYPDLDLFLVEAAEYMADVAGEIKWYTRDDSLLPDFPDSEAEIEGDGGTHFVTSHEDSEETYITVVPASGPYARVIVSLPIDVTEGLDDVSTKWGEAMGQVILDSSAALFTYMMDRGLIEESRLDEVREAIKQFTGMDLV